jgi:hypothetical protein
MMFDCCRITACPASNHIVSGGNGSQRCGNRSISTNGFARKIQVWFHHDGSTNKREKSLTADADILPV